jgi:hypothetical protein
MEADITSQAVGLGANTDFSLMSFKRKNEYFSRSWN